MLIFEAGLPKRILCKDNKEFLKIVNLNNGKKKAIYRTLYNFEKMNGDIPDYDTAKIDRIFWDFDGDGSWEEANKLHQELVKENLKHKINLSGGGYHVFLFTDGYSPSNPKSCIYNAQMHFVKKLKLKCDTQVLGDVARLYRVENTYNLRRRRFCIPLTHIEFAYGDDFCKELAKKQHFIKNSFICEKLLELKQFDFQSRDTPQFLIENLEGSSSENIVIKNLPLCIEELLKRKDLTYKQRYMVILYFKEKGYTKKEILEILKQHLSEKKFRHCIVEEKQLQYLFERDDLLFPVCDKIKKDGYCVEGCKIVSNHNIYK